MSDKNDGGDELGNQTANTTTVYLTVNSPGWLDEEIKRELGYEDSKSGWIKDAIVQRLERERDDWTVDEDLITWRN